MQLSKEKNVDDWRNTKFVRKNLFFMLVNILDIREYLANFHIPEFIK